MNEGSEIFQNRTGKTTDILHEYFIPPRNIEPFVVDLREIIPRHHGNLMNVTIRSMERDDDSFLRYADERMYSLVMLFNQPRTADGEARMEAMTRDLIDAALSAGGRYYLPYRLHASRAQFERAYPKGGEFFRLKREYDPDELFQNQFYLKYGK
jgi:FAD/FMN-containing dehydrogenase